MEWKLQRPFVMNKHEIKKKINSNLDKIMENFIETLLIIKRKDNDMRGLFFAKRRIIDIMSLTIEVQDNLIKLNRINKITEQNKTEAEEKRLFIDFINKM